MWCRHQWSPWYDCNYNKYPYIQPKRQERICEKCGKAETRALPALETRILEAYGRGLTARDIADALQCLMNETGKMRYDYVIKRLLDEVIEGRR